MCNKGRLYLSLVLTCVIHRSVKELKIETTTIVIKNILEWNEIETNHKTHIENKRVKQGCFIIYSTDICVIFFLAL